MLLNILQLAREEHTGTPAGPPPDTDPLPIIKRLLDHLATLSPNPAVCMTVGQLPPVAASAAVPGMAGLRVPGTSAKCMP